MRTRDFTLVAFTACVLGCEGGAVENLPPVAGRVDQKEAQFEWDWCEATVPVLHDCGEFGSVSDIGDFISERDVCTLLAAMEEWQSLRGPMKIENVRVCRTSQWVDPPAPGESIDRDRPKVWTTFIKGDMPEQGLCLWVFLHEDSGEVTIDTGVL